MKKCLWNNKNMKNNQWLKSAWAIGIGCAIIPIVYDIIKNNPILSSLSSILKIIYNCIISVLNFEIRLWWLLVATIIIYGIYYFIKKLMSEKEILPKYYTYREDIFSGWKWTWKWEINESKDKYRITNLNLHCSKCQTPMILKNGYATISYNCPRCGNSAPWDDSNKTKNIEAVIIDNANRGLFKVDV